MTEQQALTRCVEAFERIATALETMARQQGEFLATMPAEDPTLTAEDRDRLARYASDPAGVAEFCSYLRLNPEPPAHPYDATCACQACWAMRRKAKADGSP